jgi:hypothetical protein
VVQNQEDFFIIKNRKSELTIMEWTLDKKEVKEEMIKKTKDRDREKG